ncbi:MAG: DUF445 domain-containing protein [Bacteroidota bacterium]
MHWIFLLTPLVGAVIGWLMNGLLIRLLFHPRYPKKILGFTMQGILPKLQPSMAEKVGHLAGKELFSFDKIEEKITNPATLEKVMPVIETHIDEFLRVKLAKEMPMISMFIGDKTIESMKKIFMKELGALFPQVMKNYAANLRNDIDIEKMVREKIASFPQEQLESVLTKELSAQFRMIKIIGATAGFLIGLIQVLLTFVLF